MLKSLHRGPKGGGPDPLDPPPGSATEMDGWMDGREDGGGMDGSWMDGGRSRLDCPCEIETNTESF